MYRARVAQRRSRMVLALRRDTLHMCKSGRRAVTAVALTLASAD
ncbi:hypothetical protein BURMUCGD1_5476 [Burkholderia multivorans CGD1]|nr:hypothetical protein BURMUCGD1_5476 [Burkholderia multivorans CGD1]